MTGTPGQRAASVFWKQFVSDPAVMYERLNDRSRTLWEAVAEAGAADVTAERDALRELLDIMRGRLGDLARGLDVSAASTAPSKKSEIERGCATAVLDIARPPD